MRLRTYVLLVLLGFVAVACGTTVSDDEAASELRAEATSLGGSNGASGVQLGSGSGAEAADSGSETGGGELESDAGSATEGSGGETAGATGTGEGASAGGGTQAAGSGPVRSQGGATDVGVTENELRLGWVGTLTGPVPGIFKGALVGTQAWINYQNSRGGLMGRQLRLVPADDSLDSGKNRAAHLQLKDKVFSFVGSFSINDDGGASVVNECKCPDVSGNLSVAMHESPYHFGPQPAAPGWRSGPPRYYAKKFGKEVIEKLAFFYSQVPVSEAIAVQQRRVYEEAGFKIVYSRGLPPNDNQQTADVVQMQRAGVRAIAFQGDLDTKSRLINAMAQQNFTVDLFNLGNAIYDANTFNVIEPGDVKNLHVDQVYAMFLGEDAERIPEIRLFNEWMKKTDPRQPVNLFAMYGWLSGRLFGDVMLKMQQEGKNPVRADLVNALKGWGTWDGYGMVAPVKIGTKSPSDCFFVFTSTPDGKFQRTFPESGQNYACDQGPFDYKK